jgi:hypothetical protein
MASTTFNGPVVSTNGFTGATAGTHTGPVVGKNSPVESRAVAAVVTTAGVVAYTAAQVLGGMILRDPNGAARADTVPTAALLAAALPAGAAVAGDSVEFQITNTADAAETITVTTDTGATLSGTMTIAQSASRRFRAIFTSSSAYTLYSAGSFTT